MEITREISGRVTHGKPTPSWGKLAKNMQKPVGCSEPHMAFSACWSKILDCVKRYYFTHKKQSYYHGDFRRCVSLLDPTHLIDEITDFLYKNDHKIQDVPSSPRLDLWLSKNLSTEHSCQSFGGRTSTPINVGIGDGIWCFKFCRLHIIFRYYILSYFFPICSLILGDTSIPKELWFHRDRDLCLWWWFKYFILISLPQPCFPENSTHSKKCPISQPGITVLTHRALP